MFNCQYKYAQVGVKGLKDYGRNVASPGKAENNNKNNYNKSIICMFVDRQLVNNCL